MAHVFVDLVRVLEVLQHVFTHTPPVGYLGGKTLIRDALVDELNLSDLESEELVDALEAHGALVFEGDPAAPAETDTPWALHPDAIEGPAEGVDVDQPDAALRD